MVVMAQQHWTTVRGAMPQPDDVLIVECEPIHGPRFAGITVYATQVTTKALQAAKRKDQAASVRAGAGGG